MSRRLEASPANPSDLDGAGAAGERDRRLAGRGARADDAAAVAWPSPLAGEGSSAVQQQEWVRGLRPTPHPQALAEIPALPSPAGGEGAIGGAELFDVPNDGLRSAALDFVQMIFASVDACATPAREKSWHLPFAHEARHPRRRARPTPRTGRRAKICTIGCRNIPAMTSMAPANRKASGLTRPDASIGTGSTACLSASAAS